MPATLTKVTRTKLLGSYTVIIDVKIGAYATGGVSITPAQLGLQTVEMLVAETSGLYLFKYDYTNKKLKGYKVVDGTEVADTTDLSGVTIRVMAIGK